MFPYDTHANFPFNSKLHVLVENIVKLRGGGKCLVFSQFEKSLKVLAALLAAQNFQTRIVGASITVEKRQQALDLFQTDPPTTILLLTSRSGAVGLTLTVGAPNAPEIGPRLVSSKRHLLFAPIHIFFTNVVRGACTSTHCFQLCLNQ